MDTENIDPEADANNVIDPAQLKYGDLFEWRYLHGSSLWKVATFIRMDGERLFVEGKEKCILFARAVFRVYRPVPRTKSSNAGDPCKLKPGDKFRTRPDQSNESWDDLPNFTFSGFKYGSHCDSVATVEGPVFPFIGNEFLVLGVMKKVPRTELPSLGYFDHIDPRDLKAGDFFRYKHFRETCWSDPLKVLRLNRADQFIHIDDEEHDSIPYGVASSNKFCRFFVSKPKQPGPTGVEGPKGPGPHEKGCSKPDDRDVTGAKISKTGYDPRTLANPLPDSGQRTKFATGAVRDAAAGKGCPSMVPPECLERVWKHYEKGSLKYNDSPGDLNYKKGINLSRFYDAIMRHATEAASGEDLEDHLAAVVWNAFTWMWTEKEIREGRLPSELFDLPFHKDFVPPDNFVMEMQNVGMDRLDGNVTRKARESFSFAPEAIKQRDKELRKGQIPKFLSLGKKQFKELQDRQFLNYTDVKYQAPSWTPMFLNMEVREVSAPDWVRVVSEEPQHLYSDKKCPKCGQVETIFYPFPFNGDICFRCHSLLVAHAADGL